MRDQVNAGLFEPVRECDTRRRCASPSRCWEREVTFLKIDDQGIGLCLDHADELMWRLSKIEPEGRSGYLGWRAEMESRGAVLPVVLP